MKNLKNILFQILVLATLAWMAVFINIQFKQIKKEIISNNQEYLKLTRQAEFCTRSILDQFESEAAEIDSTKRLLEQQKQARRLQLHNQKYNH